MRDFKKGLSLSDRLKVLIEASDMIIEKDSVDEADFKLYKDSCHKILKDIIKKVNDETVVGMSVSGLDLKLRSSKSPLSRLFYHLFYTGAMYQHKAPFLSKGSETDNYKSFVFFMKIKLEGILFNVKKYELK